ncbi:MAG: hypothetical protein SVY10_07940 [Thermodesulfobacteriota bacterium]|nr:hypothetical protein [Thermodesulfobacteriota bacterium]
MFKTKKKTATIVCDNELHFVKFDIRGVARISQTLPLSQFLTENELYPIPEEIRHNNDHALIVPDYWLGHFDFQFQTKKKSIVESYIERKLSTDYSHSPDMGHFYDYINDKTPQGDIAYYVYFLQESRSIQLYQRLSEYKLYPTIIAAPSLIWERRLNSLVPDFSKDGKLLIYLTSKGCFLYFFFMGYSLFSRDIPFTHSEVESSESLNTIGYEINQSFYSFSQKTKSEIAQIFLLSYGSDDTHTEELAKILDRKVENLKNLNEEFNNPDGEDLGPLGRFTIKDLSVSRRPLNLVNKQVKTDLEWRPIQKQGIAVGICLLLLLIVQGVFLWEWLPSRQSDFRKSGTWTKTEYRQTLRQYNNALEQLIGESNRPSAQKIITQVANALPENITLRKMTVEIEPNPSVYLEGVSKDSGPNRFKESLTHLLSNIRTQFPGSGYLFLKDIDFEKDNKSHNSNPYVYKFKFKFPI